MEMSKATTNISDINVWCGVNCDHIIGLYIFLQRLTGDIYANFLQHELPA